MHTESITEGKTKVLVPILDKNHNYPPASASVFYNPNMELCRDINIACIRAFSKSQNLSYIDALSATGISGIRVANEGGAGVGDMTINDFSKSAHELILKNVQMTQISPGTPKTPETIGLIRGHYMGHIGNMVHIGDITVHRENANVLLLKRRYDIVDIDPFGSPTPFLDAASQSVEKLLCVTATDTAPLCGAHKNSGVRKYACVPLKTEYHKEMGVRILLVKILRDLACFDKSGKPLLSYTTRHFVRTYLKIEKSAKKADICIEKLGFILHCFNCGFRSFEYGLAIFVSKTCPNCNDKLSLAGPLYLGPIHEKKFCKEVLDELESIELGTYKKAVKIVQACLDELGVNIPYYYDHHVVCKKLKVTPTTLDELISRLQNENFSATKTHFSGTSFKTNARIDEMEKIIKVLDSS